MPYLLDGKRFDPMKGERLSKGWIEILRILKDGKVHLWSDVLIAVQNTTDLQAKTITNLLHRGVQSGYFARTGDYKSGTRSIVQIKWED